MQQIYRLSLVTLVALLGSILWLSGAKPLLAAPVAQATADPVFVGAGAITDCEPNAANNRANATANLLDGIAGTVFTLGDHDDATDGMDCYDDTWGRHFARTQPVAGETDYDNPDAANYYEYFGAAASPQDNLPCGSNCKGYYSYKLGAWHIVALNSELTDEAMKAEQLRWLRDDLAANPNQCTLAYWNRPRFTSGPSGGLNFDVQPFWDTLYHYGADVILNGGDHHYERFALQNPAGQADPTRGLRQFVVGTGGAALGSLNSPATNSEVRNNSTHGLLKLTLHPSSYDWNFVPIAGQTFTDNGTTTCNNARPTFAAPVGYWRMQDFASGKVLNSATGGADASNAGAGGVTFENNLPDNNIGWNSLESTKRNQQSAKFGAFNSYLEVANNALYNLKNEATVAAWVNLANPSPDQKIVGQLWLDFPNGSGYLLGVNNGQLQAEVFDNNQQKFEAKGGTIPAATWTHLAMTWKTSGQLISYINGVAVATATASALPIGNICQAGKGGCNVIIGAAPWDPRELRANGNIDEVLIFDEALTADAITQLAQRTFIVASSSNAISGCAGADCSLKTAIEGANAGPNGALRDRIHFALPAPALIQPDALLPVVTEAAVIDGLTQPGASCGTWPPTIKVALDGANLTSFSKNGLPISARNALVRGLNVRNFGGAAIVMDSVGSLIECNLIGTDLTGTAAAPNNIGVDLTPGIRDQIVHNLIAGNREVGINAVNEGHTLIQGNYIGTNISGTVAIANGVGIRLSESSNSRIGGATEQARNLIAGNSTEGIRLGGGSNNTIEGNIIGADVIGQVALANGGAGILVDGSANNTIGGKNAGNLIAYNLKAGVVISETFGPATNNFIAENRIYRNTPIGIDLGNDGVTANDAGDGDGGPNRRQNFPVLTGAASNGSTTTISGTLNSLANTEYLIEFYSNVTNDACQGETFLGFAFVTTDANGNIAFSATLPKGVFSGRKLSATASDMTSFETSEFSACVPVVAPPPVSPTVTLTPFQPTFNEGASSARLTVQLSQSTSEPITVLFSTIVPNLPAAEVATPGSDYTAATNQSLVIPAGAISRTLAIPLLEDTLVEQNERFGVTIALPANSIALLDSANSTSVVTIADNDGANNALPVAQAQTVNGQAGVPQPITLVGVDVDSDPLTFTILTQPQNGTLSGAAPTVTYTPNPGFAGADSFTFKVNDGKVDSPAATVTLLVKGAAGVNTAPLAQAQTVNVQAGVAQQITLVGVDVESDPLTFAIVTQPQNGTLSGTAPTVTYTPNPGFAGADSFTFKVNDGKVDSPAATVTLLVKGAAGVNTAPVAQTQTVNVQAGLPQEITLVGVDTESDPLTFAIVTQPQNGTLSGTAPTVTYTPNPGFAGADSFTFKVNDGKADSTTVTVTLRVAQNNVPGGSKVYLPVIERQASGQN